MTHNSENHQEISRSRKAFFDLLADYWKSYGLPGLCGYIDALLWLEQQGDWTQQAISNRLKILFGSASSYPTSVPSINRAIRINIQYGTVKRRGNHKLGYTYHVAEASTMLINMFQKLIDFNELMLEKLDQLLRSEDTKSDPDLIQAIHFQTIGTQVYNDSLLTSFEFLKSQLQESNE
ncbi:MAG: hypothetical protein ACXACP_04655 [Candidatus Hodarchaeales archaeon]|jgi:hypothetical protein